VRRVTREVFRWRTSSRGCFATPPAIVVCGLSAQLKSQSPSCSAKALDAYALVY